MRPIALFAALLLPAPALALGEWSPFSSPVTHGAVEDFLSHDGVLYVGTISSDVYASDDHGVTWTEVGGGLDDEYAPVADMVRLGDTFLMSRAGFGELNFRSTYADGAWSDWTPLPYQDDELRSFTVIGETVFAFLHWTGPARSVDQGETWEPLVLPDGATPYTLFTHDGYLFAADNGFDSGNLYRSADLGDTWVVLGDELDNSGVLCHAMFEGTLLVSQYLGGGRGSVWASTDLGDSWTEVATIPTWYNINGMATTDDGWLAIGASSGADGGSIFITRDLVTWMPYTGDLPYPSVAVLLSHDGRFYKTGGSVVPYTAAHPSFVAVPQGGESSLVALEARPNPSRGVTTLAFELEAGSDVSVEVFDATGRRVASLLEGALTAGRHSVSWDGRDLAGREVAAGVYLVRVETGESFRYQHVTRIR